MDHGSSDHPAGCFLVTAVTGRHGIAVLSSLPPQHGPYAVHPASLKPDSLILHHLIKICRTMSQLTPQDTSSAPSYQMRLWPPHASVARAKPRNAVIGRTPALTRGDNLSSARENFGRSHVQAVDTRYGI